MRLAQCGLHTLGESHYAIDRVKDHNAQWRDETEMHSVVRVYAERREIANGSSTPQHYCKSGGS